MALWPRKQSNLSSLDANNWALSSQANAANSQAAMYRSQINALMAQQMGYFNAAPDQPTITPSKNYPNTLGFRSWVWDMTANELRSPVHSTAWDGPELRCETWDEAQVVRGVAGIHAYLVPDDWHTIPIPEAPNGGRAYAELREGTLRACVAVHGLVERFGKFVLGTDGWRAEWVVIRKLSAPTDEIGLALERAFPDAEVIYGNR